tara:strand:- start:367 stop:588 length:222 start_codon:yes stop_codon:yes gene_type:complete
MDTSNKGILVCDSLHQVEQSFNKFTEDRKALIEATKKAINEQEQLARRADAAILRLERQLDALETPTFNLCKS